MAYEITDACVACGACISECPVEDKLPAKHQKSDDVYISL